MGYATKPNRSRDQLKIELELQEGDWYKENRPWNRQNTSKLKEGLKRLKDDDKTAWERVIERL
jgi:hypothetical protein